MTWRRLPWIGVLGLAACPPVAARGVTRTEAVSVALGEVHRDRTSGAVLGAIRLGGELD